MRNKRLALCVCVVLLVFLQAARAAPGGTDEVLESRPYTMRAALFSALTAHRDFVMLGDSITASGEWSELLPDASIANRGISGDTTLGMLARLAPVLSMQPAAVFVMAGINDLRRRRRSVDETLDTYRSVIEAILRGGSRVVVQSTLLVRLHGREDLNDSVGRLNTKLRDYCGSQDGCEFVDLNPALSPCGRLASAYTGDGIHLNGAGYLRWSAEIRALVGRIADSQSASPMH